jgi:hypothetical protein
MHKRFWSKNMKERDHSEGIGIYEKIILEWISGKYGAKVWTGIIWLRVWISGWLLCTW